MTNHATQALETKPVGQLLKEYSIPAIIGSSVMILYNIVDRVFIGQGVGPYAISGLALTLPIAAIQTAFGTLIGVGASARISIVLGMKDKKWAERILAHAFILSIVLSVVFIGFIQYFLHDILLLMGGTENTIPYATEYLRITNAGSILTTITYSYGNVIRASGYPRKQMRIMLLGALLNTILDPLFIFGFGLGIKGAAIATVISMGVTTVIVLQHYVSKDSYIRFRREAFKFDYRVVRNIFAIGLSPFIVNILMSVVGLIMNHSLLEYGGDLAIGAYGIIGSVVMLVVMVLMGLGQGMQPILGYNYGAGHTHRLQQTLRLGLFVGVGVTTLGFLGGEILPKYIVSLFTPDTELSTLAERGMRIQMIVFPLVGIQVVITTFFQSIGWIKSSITLSLSRQLIFLIPSLIILPKIFGLDGVWAASPTADFLSFLVTTAVFYVQRKKLFKPER